MNTPDLTVVTRARGTSRARPFGSRGTYRGRRSVALLAAAALVGVVLVGGSMLVGSGIVRYSAPTPSTGASPQVTPSAPTPTSSPSESSIDASTPVAAGPGSWTMATVGRSAGFGGGTATVLLDGRVLFAGGEDAHNQSGNMAGAELFDPVTGLSSETGSMQVPRRDHTATLLADGRVLVAGGWDLGGPSDPTAVAELYDPASGTWTETGSMTRWREHPLAVLLADGRVLVVGGLISGGGITRGAEIYDPQAGTWRPVSQMSGPPVAAIRLADGRVLVLHPGSDAPELFDAATGRWTATNPPIDVRTRYRVLSLPDGRVLLLGLTGGSFDVAELYDRSAGTWTNTARPPTNVGPAALLPDGTVMVVDQHSAARLTLPTRGGRC